MSLKQEEGQKKHFVENLEQKVSNQQLYFEEKEENNSIFEDIPVSSSPVKTIQEPDTESLTSFYSVNSEEPEDNSKRKVKFGRSYEDLINELVAEEEQTMSPSRLLENL